MVRAVFLMSFSVFFAFNSLLANAAIQKTFAMIKPSGMSKTNEIKAMINSYGLKVQKTKKIVMTEREFNQLYFMHKEKPFFAELKSSLVNKEVEVMVLQGEDAVRKYRLAVSDIRKRYALNPTENAVHGSDTWKRAHEEICIFFDCSASNKKVKKAVKDGTSESVKSDRGAVAKKVDQTISSDIKSV